MLQHHHEHEPGERALRAAARALEGVSLYISAPDRYNGRPHVHLRYRGQCLDVGLASFASCYEAQQWLTAGANR